ncbi:MAG: hypothetical protein WA908_11875 [Pontixanthobacter sp.]
MKSFGYLLAGIGAASLPASAIAADQKCVSRAESQAVVAHLMPSLLNSLERNCSGKIGDDTYLSRNAANLARNASATSRNAWPVTKAVFERQGGEELPDNDMLLEFGRSAIAEGITGGLKAKECSTVNALIEQLAPLPPKNFANVFALFLEVGMNESKDSPIKVCAAPATRSQAGG